MIGERPAGAAAAAVLFALSEVGCGTKVATPPAPEPVVEAAVPPPRRPVGSVVETQDSGPLPAARPVSLEAAPAGPEPLAGEAGRLPRDGEAESLREGNSEDDVADEGGQGPKAATPRGAIPRLGPVLTRDQRRQRSRLIDRDLDAARRIVTGIVGRDLTAQQINTVRRIREFLRQADEARSRDPALARKLADRAALLARDLAAGLD